MFSKLVSQFQLSWSWIFPFLVSFFLAMEKPCTTNAIFPAELVPSVFNEDSMAATASISWTVVMTPFFRLPLYNKVHSICLFVENNGLVTSALKTICIR